MKAYYFSGKPKFVGGSLSNSVLKFHGNFINYFPNGKFYCRQSYIKVGPKSNQQLLKDCSDSAGKVLATEGTGSWVIFNDDFSKISEKGKVTNGLRDSIWEVAKKDSAGFANTYKDGRLLESQPCTIINGKLHVYVEVVPEFIGGLKNLESFLVAICNTQSPPEQIIHKDGLFYHL